MKRGHNSWRLVVETGYDSDGKRVQERKTVRIEEPEILKSVKKTREYLQTEHTKFRLEVESGSYVKPDRTLFSAFVAEWKRNYADHHRAYGYTICDIPRR